MVTFQALIKKKIQQGLTRINVAPGVYGWMKGICKDNAFTVHPALIAQLVKNLPAMQETLVQFLGWEYPLEKG